MNIRIKILLLTGIIVSSFTSKSQDIWKEFEHLFMPPRNYVVYNTTGKIDIDGKTNEADWEHAQWSEYHKDIEGDSKPEPLYQTREKMLWDKNNLYILAELKEPHIWAYYDKRDMVVFHENDIEVFIDPDRDTHNYYEFEVNARNILFDLFMNKPYRNGGHANIPWNAKGFKSAVQIDGTLNNPTDIDRKWTVEMAIPFSSLTTDGAFIQPENGNVWKINFSRVNWQTDIIDGKYVRKINPETNKKYPEYNWVWSPQGIINMHFPERWSMIQFSSNKVGNKKEIFQLPLEEIYAKYLWLTYYKQRSFLSRNGKYTSILSDIDLKDKWNNENLSFELTLEATKKTYTIYLKAENGMQLSLNQEGLFKVISK